MRLASEIEFEFVEGDRAGFVATDQVREVILRHLTLGQIDSAASQLATSAPEVGDMLIEQAATASLGVRSAMAEMFLQARDYRRAGRAALMLGDPARAAPYFERSDQFEHAAELYEQAKMLDRAAELHERLLHWDRAAQLHEQLGHLDRAAVAHEKGGRKFEAGAHWARLKRFDRAVEALQQVDRASDRWVDANILLGRILDSAGHKEAAAARWAEVLRLRRCDAETVGVYERLAEIYLEANDVRTTRRLVAAILQFDPNREQLRPIIAALGPIAGEAPAPAPPPVETAAQPRADRGATAVLGRESTGAVPAAPPAAQPSAAPALAVVARAADDGVAPLVLPPAPGEHEPASLVPHMSAVHRDVDRLRTLPIFGELSLDELRGLHAIGQRVSIPAGTVFITQDQPAEHLFVILEGRVEVSRVENGRSAVLAQLGVGAPLGEMALVDEGPTSASVKSLAPVVAFRWQLDELRSHLAKQDRTALRILRVMSRTLSVRLREANRLARS